MPVGGVDDQHVDAGVDQPHRPSVRGVADADRGGDQQPAVPVLGRVRVLLGLGEVLHGDQPAELAVTVDQRQLLDLVSTQQTERHLGGAPDRSGDQRHRRHHLADRAIHVHLEPHVPVGDDAHQTAFRVGDGHARDAEHGAHPVRIADGRVRRAGDRVGHHAGLGSLDDLDLGRLVLRLHVVVQHPDPALPGHRDGHPGLGHGVHRTGDQRNCQRDVTGQPGAGVSLAGHQIGGVGQQQNIVVGQADQRELVVERPTVGVADKGWTTWHIGESRRVDVTGWPGRCRLPRPDRFRPADRRRRHLSSVQASARSSRLRWTAVRRWCWWRDPHWCSGPL